MAYNNIEIEIKLPLKNKEAVLNFLDKYAQKKANQELQKDTYFTPAHKDFLSPDFPYEWLRLRESGKKLTLNYKHFYPENAKNINYCDELETEVSDLIIKKIFTNLNFKELVVVNKNRATWLFKDVEIAIDSVEELGSFIELEATTNFDDPKKAKEYLYLLVREIGAETGEEDYRGYPFLVLEKKGYNFKN